MKIITLTLNPAYDVHCYVKDFQPYHENLASISSRDAGGKGVNISRALCMAGVENTALVVLGEDNAKDFESQLEKDGICASVLTVKGRIRENITLHTDGRAETRISFSGFEADGALVLRLEELLCDIADENTVLTFTGRIPEGLSKESVKSFLMRQKARGVRVVVDSRSFDKHDVLELCPYLIKPNEEEVALYSDTELTDLASALSAAKRLRESGVENVMISLGARGAVLCCEDGEYFASAPRIDALSTIGAGDSSIAGYLAALKNGLSNEEKLRTAVAYGSAACLTSGTKPPRKEDIERLYGDVTVKKM